MKPRPSHRIAEASLVEDIAYPESPRWRDGLLWFSDVWNFRLKACDEQGRIVHDIAALGRPAGLGFLPDGALLMATAQDRCLHRVVDGALETVADLSPLTRGLLNDMVVDATGRAYVGDTGFDFAAGEAPRSGQILLWQGASPPKVVCSQSLFPNGMAISPDGKTLYVAESLAGRVCAFPIRPDGSLGHARVHAVLDGTPDGLCLDSDGALWVASLRQGSFLRIDASGQVVDRVDVAPEQAVSCCLGGPTGDTLFLCSSTPAVVPGGKATGAICRHAAPARGVGSP